MVLTTYKACIAAQASLPASPPPKCSNAVPYLPAAQETHMHTASQVLTCLQHTSVERNVFFHHWLEIQLLPTLNSCSVGRRYACVQGRCLPAGLPHSSCSTVLLTAGQPFTVRAGLVIPRPRKVMSLVFLAFVFPSSIIPSEFST